MASWTADLHAALSDLAARLEDARDDESAIRAYLRAACRVLGATSGAWIVPVEHPPFGVDASYDVGETASWNTALLAAFFRDERPKLPFDLLVHPVRRRGRRAAALALHRARGDFPRGSGKGLEAFAGALSRQLARIDELRVAEVRLRLDRKIQEQIRPRDLFYHVLDALRAVVRYDHSSALLVTADRGATFEVAAEQVAWRKGPSRLIGTKLEVPEPLRASLGESAVRAYTRDGEAWRRAGDGGDAWLAALLDYNRVDPEGGAAHRESAILAAPLATRDGAIGLIKVAGSRPGAFGEHEARWVAQLAAPASVAIQVLQGTESLRERIFAAERKHAFADIARGVAHDVNNALGSVLPLVQQIRADAAGGRIDPVVLADDLSQIEESVLVCRRIFGGMLSFARGADGRVGQGNLRRALDATFAIVRHSLDRHGIGVDLRIAATLPPVRCGQGDLEQLLLNLVTNARDAMPSGGRLTVTVGARDGVIDVVVEDTGTGIAPADLERIHEPFFTTKPDGNGLGLSICRSILWSMNGSMRLDSEPGRGTRVALALPSAVAGE